MNLILETEFGSKVYGSSVPTSDVDIKGIFIPDARDILLQRAPKSIQQNTKKDNNSKNSKDDVDREYYSLHYYLKLLCEGQTPCIDLLFTPKEFHLQEASPIFWEIYNNRDKILSKNLTAVVSYARTQAAKYGLKGTRIAAFRDTLACLETMEEQYDLKHAGNLIKLLYLVYKYPESFEGLDTLDKPLTKLLAKNNEYINFVNIKNPRGVVEPHLEVCGKKYALHCTVKYVKEKIQEKLDNYGRRALAAEKNEGVDWKALYHAIRVSAEGIELCTTGNITFPRPEAALLLQVRNGELPYKQVAEIIEQQLETLEKVQHTGVLRDKPDYNFVESFIEDVYSKEVIDYYNIYNKLLREWKNSNVSDL